MTQMWRVTMRGRRGYHCETMVHPDNAPTIDDASTIASMMFPELTIAHVQAVVVSGEVEPNELPT